MAGTEAADAEWHCLPPALLPAPNHPMGFPCPKTGSSLPLPAAAGQRRALGHRALGTSSISPYESWTHAGTFATISMK